ncbi:Metal dependent phosphohydrolase [Oceanicola granulosus HTCC2516]|uniref:Metal dependent phosphohydrolase n=1 Tax=Oceanicola granulosus (strain ATCC BAA-861 / DSM 15982 / KCTC 12143 / HTCC2516) TaxID=314256 RepID=Q2CB05_OCEGH|nr:HD domain-containing protein [Oceanicola granulosus]EAR49871.1 Metal dependent phosphohydrolase [Oceanicola granulosus HTCC2516]
MQPLRDVPAGGPSADTPADIAAAALLAARAHLGQVRKGAGQVPYIHHPLEVADLVGADGAGAPVIVAALLHDVVEDTEIARADIAARFGSEVAALVDALTDDPAWAGLPRPARKARQAEEMPSAPPEARRIKIADQISNLRDIARAPEAWDPAEAVTYIDNAERVVDACRGVSPGLEALFDAAAAEAMQKIPPSSPAGKE